MFPPTPLSQLHEQTLETDSPAAFQGPYEPMSPLARSAMAHWLEGVTTNPPAWYRALYEAGGGKMFGVLVVETAQGPAYWMAYSGMLDGQWVQPGFVPPIFDVTKGLELLAAADREIGEFDQQISNIEDSSDYLKAQSRLVTLKKKSTVAFAELKSHRDMRRAKRREIRAHGNDIQIAFANRESQAEKATLRHIKRMWAHDIQVELDAVAVFEQQIRTIADQRSACSREAQTAYFQLYQLRNALGETRSLTDLFETQTPPSGAGDCAAPKLLQVAWSMGLRPLALAEFWLGASPLGEVRHDRQSYPPCRSRCAPILAFMLSTSDDNARELRPMPAPMLRIVMEDEHLLVVEKPSGLLSVPGKSDAPSVYSLMVAQYPSDQIFAVHRLDQDTSGLLLLAKSLSSYQQLQKQFMSRTVRKRYVAVVSAPLPSTHGVINLPLRVDLHDRPRQMVCHTYGKPAKTEYQVLAADNDTTTVEFFPITGRTHQLRVHAAHASGLNAPILHDALYGNASADSNNTEYQHLHLHAAALSFSHPATAEMISLESAAPFLDSTFSDATLTDTTFTDNKR